MSVAERMKGSRENELKTRKETMFERDVSPCQLRVKAVTFFSYVSVLIIADSVLRENPKLLTLFTISFKTTWLLKIILNKNCGET